MTDESNEERLERERIQRFIAHVERKAGAASSVMAHHPLIEIFDQWVDPISVVGVVLENDVLESSSRVVIQLSSGGAIALPWKHRDAAREMRDRVVSDINRSRSA